MVCARHSDDDQIECLRITNEENLACDILVIITTLISKSINVFSWTHLNTLVPTDQLEEADYSSRTVLMGAFLVLLLKYEIGIL